MEHITKSITVKRQRQEVFGFWRNLENLPRFMYHLQEVTTTDNTHVHTGSPKAPQDPNTSGMRRSSTSGLAN